MGREGGKLVLGVEGRVRIEMLKRLDDMRVARTGRPRLPEACGGSAIVIEVLKGQRREAISNWQLALLRQ